MQVISFIMINLHIYSFISKVVIATELKSNNAFGFTKEKGHLTYLKFLMFVNKQYL